ncbi:hypothetical protein J3F84DRAFT_207764 [Trichoderma pleuroticola]
MCVTNLALYSLQSLDGLRNSKMITIHFDRRPSCGVCREFTAPSVISPTSRSLGRSAGNVVSWIAKPDVLQTRGFHQMDLIATLRIICQLGKYERSQSWRASSFLLYTRTGGTLHSAYVSVKSTCCERLKQLEHACVDTVQLVCVPPRLGCHFGWLTKDLAVFGPSELWFALVLHPCSESKSTRSSELRAARELSSQDKKGRCLISPHPELPALGPRCIGQPSLPRLPRQSRGFRLS